jgi:phosphoglycolate phosphatase-like HAD superfamily hydrolase
VAAGLAPPAIDARADDVMAACGALYGELCPADLRPCLAPGVPEALAQLGARRDAYRHSLVTGNYERVARLKLARAGIADWFPEGQGGFGSDAEERERLPAIARERAGGWPRERTVVIGDTPRDIACARADGLRVIAVTTGPFAVEALADADAVVDSARAVPAALEDFL